MAAPIVGEKIIGARSAWRSFQAAIRRSAFSCAPGRRFLLRGFAAAILNLAAIEAHSRIVVE